MKNRLKTMVCTYLEPEQVDRLDALASKTKKPKAVHIRKAIDEYLAREDRRAART